MERNVEFIFVNPNTKLYGEVFFNDSSESISLTYEDILKEINKYTNNYNLNNQIKEFFISYTPFIINIKKNSIQELQVQTNEIELKNDIKNQVFKQSINEKLNANNINTIENIQKKLESISINNDYSKNFFDKKIKKDYTLNSRKRFF